MLLRTHSIYPQLYLLRAPTKEEEEWWIEPFNSLGGSEGGQIETTKCPSYAKTHSKTPDSCQTLERALNKGESAFADYSVKVMNTLNRAAGCSKQRLVL